MRIPLLLCPLLLGCRATPTDGAEASVLPPAETDARQTVGVTLENDFFTGSDNNYTNGLAVSWVSGRTSTAPEGSLQRRWVDLLSFLPFVDEERYATYATWSVAQEIFTPDDISDPDPPEDDQPYAGFLFLDTGLYAKSRRSCHTYRLRLGLVGPSTHADDLQRESHELVGDDEPEGWNTQLPDEFVFNADYNVAYEWLSDVPDGGFAWRLVPVGGASLGTYFTGASGAFYWELGWNLPDTVGLLSLRRGIDPVSAVSAGRWKDLSVSLYAGSGGFLVGHYLPLDGTVFEDSRSVESEPLVGFATAGIALRYDRFAVGYLVTGFTDTFETERSANEFGSLTVSWSF